MACASQSNGAEISVAAVSPTVSQTLEMMGTSHRATTPLPSFEVPDSQETVWPTVQKKLISVTLAPVTMAAPQEISTPTFPRLARWGFEELDPKPQTTADTMSASTDRIRPIVITAPTMVRSAAIPGSPESRSKSTRLNSSHVSISYAVFCLKKKK